MLALHFDPITTEIVIGTRKKQQTDNGEGGVATFSSFYVPSSLELLTNKVNVVESIEIGDTGAFTIQADSIVEVL